MKIQREMCHVAALLVCGVLVTLLVNVRPAHATLWNVGDLITYNQASWGGGFGGEVLGLEFNVDFSDAGFLTGTAGIPFGDLIFTGFPLHSSLHPLNGLTVREFLGVVNTLLGGGSSIVTIDGLGTAVGDVSGSFFGGQPSLFAQDHLVAPNVPEPSSWVLLALGGAVLAWMHMRIRRARASRLALWSSKCFVAQEH